MKFIKLLYLSTFEFYDKYKKNFPHYLIRGISIFLNIFSIAVISRYFTLADLSEYYLLMPFVTIFTMVLISPFSTFLINYCLKNNESLLDYFNAIQIFLITASILVVVAYFILLNEIEVSNILFIIYLFFEINIGTFFGFITQIESFNGNHSVSSKIQLFLTLTTGFIPILLMLFIRIDLIFFIIGLISARLIQLFILLWYKRKFLNLFGKGGYGVIAKLLRNNYKNILFILLASFMGWLNLNFIKVIADFLNINNLATFLFLITSSFTLVSTTELFFRSNIDRILYVSITNRNPNFLKYIVNYYFSVMCISLLVGPFAINVITNYRFSKYINFLYFFIIIDSLKIFINFLISYLQTNFFYTVAFILNLILCINLLIFNYFTAMFFNEKNLFLIMVTSNIISLFMILFFTFKRCKNSFFMQT